MGKLRGAAESLQLQKHFSPGGVGDATHSKYKSAGDGAGGSVERTGAGGEEAAGRGALWLRCAPDARRFVSVTRGLVSRVFWMKLL